MPSQSKQVRRFRFLIVALALCGYLLQARPGDASVDPCNPLPDAPTPTLAKAPTKLVGIAYSTRYGPNNNHQWDSTSDPPWGTPLCGTYSSEDPVAIERHGRQLAYAGVDFAAIDLTNSYCYSDPACPLQSNPPEVGQKNLVEENAAIAVADTWSASAYHPKIAILTHGNLDDLNKSRQALDWIYTTFIANPTRNSVYQYYKGKPLVILFTGGVPPFTPPVIIDDRFTIRWSTGLIDGRDYLWDTSTSDPRGLTKWWSFADRTTSQTKNGTISPPYITPTYNLDPTVPSTAMHLPEHVAVEGSYPGTMRFDYPTNIWRWEGALTKSRNGATGDTACDAAGGTNGYTFIDQWKRAMNIDPEIVTLVGWNAWVLPGLHTCPSEDKERCNPNYQPGDPISPRPTDQLNARCSTDLEPTVEHGDFYLELLKTKIKEFKAYRSDLMVRDTTNGYFTARNKPDFSFIMQRPWNKPDTQTSQYQPLAGDFNGDGLSDIGVREVSVTSGRVTLQFAPNYTTETGFDWFPGSAYKAFTGDFNGDKKVDVGVWDTTRGLMRWRYAPDFSALTEGTYQWPGPPTGQQYTPFTGDFDGDAVLDIGVFDSLRDLFLYRTGPAYISQTAFDWSNVCGAVCNRPFQPFSGDFNGDGIWDIGVRSVTDGVFTWRHGPTYAAGGAYPWIIGSQYQAVISDVR